MMDRLAIEEMKISSLARGMRISDSVLQRLGGPSSLTVHEYATTGGIPLRIGDVYLNVPFDEWYCADADVEMDLDANGLHLVYGEHRFDVSEVYPLPGYVDRVDDEGNLFTDLVFSHMDRARVSPIVGCAYNCAFCDLPGRITLRATESLLAAAEIALADEVLPVRHVLVSGGSPGPRHREAFADTIAGIVEALGGRIEVDVMMSAGEGTVWLVERLVDAGVHGFAINIEVESDVESISIIGAKYRWARPFFDETVARAVELLPPGRVRSLIIPGLESPDDTLRGVQHIASLGADPVLSPFRPARATKLVDRPPPDAGLLRHVLDGAREIVHDTPVELGPRCVPCQHNTLTFPWDVSGS